MEYGIRERVAAIVGCMSLVGVGKSYPISWGNYFWFNEPAYRCVNFWAENLEALVKNKTLEDGMVDCVVFVEPTKGKYAVIDDKRIPKDWYYNKFCFTGGYRPSLEIAREMYSIHGDPTNELEKWTDPVSYHAKRNETYDPKTGTVTIYCNAPSRTLSNVKWSISTETATYYCPYIPDAILKTLDKTIRS
jgi:hypothetical protein